MQDNKKDIKNRVLDSVGEGKGEMIQDNSIKTCILSNMKQMISPSSMHKIGHSAGALGQPRGMGWGERSEGGSGCGGPWTHVHPWLIHVSVWQKPPQYCKIISLQLKINSLQKDKSTEKRM